MRSSSRINQEQMATGLAPAASGILLIVPVVLADIVMRHHPTNWALTSATRSSPPATAAWSSPPPSPS